MKEEEEEEEEEINEEGEGRQRRKSATRKTSTRAQKRKSKNTARTSQKKRKVTRKMGEASSSSSSSSSTADSAQEAEKRRMDKVFEKAWQVFETLRRNPQLATRRSRALQQLQRWLRLQLKQNHANDQECLNLRKDCLLQDFLIIYYSHQHLLLSLPHRLPVHLPHRRLRHRHQAEKEMKRNEVQIDPRS
eukprot:TRINITY_DN618_c0_g2_i4.p1 TRINITY_DN618_c0_g2~~TRINITY_DN618_c0_g2_i4.p1  ORF type:complete len:190 (+),score=53.83 TRINITY_DN618_c0_g2_i4:798-1367(+)